jgi:hypothetical protein
MSDKPDNLILMSLRRLDAKLDGVVDVLADHGLRLDVVAV